MSTMKIRRSSSYIYAYMQMQPYRWLPDSSICARDDFARVSSDLARELASKGKLAQLPRRGRRGRCSTAWRMPPWFKAGPANHSRASMISPPYNKACSYETHPLVGHHDGPCRNESGPLSTLASREATVWWMLTLTLETAVTIRAHSSAL
jgi:hypothetical protein